MQKKLSLTIRGKSFKPLGIYRDSGTTWLFVFVDKEILILPADKNGHFDWEKRERTYWRFPLLKRVNLEDIQHLIFFEEKGLVFASFINKRASKNFWVVAKTKDLRKWKIDFFPGPNRNKLFFVPDASYEHQPVFLSESKSGKKIELVTSDRIGSWQLVTNKLLESRKDEFDSNPLMILGVKYIPEGVFLLYGSVRKLQKNFQLKIGGALLAKLNPSHVLWRSDEPLWEGSVPAFNGDGVLGVKIEDEIGVYLSSKDKKLLEIKCQNPFSKILDREKNKMKLSRHPENPIISPSSKNSWEAEAVFNPAAWYDGKLVHMLYRAVGNDGISRLGYASSSDGFSFDEKLPHPVLELKSPRKRNGKYDPTQYPSGGSYGGSEDPRMIEMNGKIYITMSAFDGWDYIRMAVVTANTKDFKKKNFVWNRPLFISPQSEIHKNWVIFPEKINGQFAILHSISPEVSVEYVDSLEDLDSGKHKFKSEFLPFDRQDRAWEHRMRGVGPPPLKTKKGWLLFYHAMDRREPHRYKIGAMLLDLNDPSKILHQSRRPILEPDEEYENIGKPGVVYACGSIIKDGELIVYYGGGDRCSCAASMNLNEFLNQMEKGETPHLEARTIQITNV